MERRLMIFFMVVVFAVAGCAGVKGTDKAATNESGFQIKKDLAKALNENEKYLDENARLETELKKIRDENDLIRKEENIGITRLQSENISLALQVKIWEGSSILAGKTRRSRPLKKNS